MAVDMVNHPPHYGNHPSGLDCIDVARHLTFDVGNAVKYVWRAEHKNGRQDLEKARWYLEDAAQHADAMMFAKNVPELGRLLGLVADSETDPNRVRFFRAIRNRLIGVALDSVNDMLDAM